MACTRGAAVEGFEAARSHEGKGVSSRKKKRRKGESASYTSNIVAPSPCMGQDVDNAARWVQGERAQQQCRNSPPPGIWQGRAEYSKKGLEKFDGRKKRTAESAADHLQGQEGG